jgi:hypothetical protein
MLSKISTGNSIINKNKAKFIDVFWKILIFMMFFLPRNFQETKMFILFILLVLNIFYVLKNKKIIINKKVIVFLFLYLTYSILSFSIGIFNNNPGAFGFGRVHILYYLLFGFLIITINNEESYKKIVKTMVVSTFCISLYSILFVLVEFNIWPEYLFYEFDVTTNLGIHRGYMHLTNTNTSMLIFLFPFVSVLFIENYNNKYLSRKMILLVEIITLATIFISGRRILWLTLLFVLIYYLIKMLFITNFKNLIYILVFLLIFISFLYYLNVNNLISFEGVSDRFLDAFKIKDNVRVTQIIKLWEGFKRNPILGVGAGKSLPNYQRGSNPGSYEASYNKILYHSGIIGFLIYFFSLGIIGYNLFINIFKMPNDKINKALALAYFSSIVANATNPYFSSSFDFLLFIFIPLMYFNCKSYN